MPSKPRKSCQLRHRLCPKLLLRAPQNLHALTRPAEAMRMVRGRNVTDGISLASQICGKMAWVNVCISAPFDVSSLGHNTAIGSMASPQSKHLGKHGIVCQGANGLNSSCSAFPFVNKAPQQQHIPKQGSQVALQCRGTVFSLCAFQYSTSLAMRTTQDKTASASLLPLRMLR